MWKQLAGQNCLYYTKNLPVKLNIEESSLKDKYDIHGPKTPIVVIFCQEKEFSTFTLECEKYILPSLIHTTVELYCTIFFKYFWIFIWVANH